MLLSYYASQLLHLQNCLQQNLSPPFIIYLSLSLFVRGRRGKPKPGPGVITASQSEWEETAGGKNGKLNALQGQRPASLQEKHKDREGKWGRRVNRAQKQHKVTDGDHLELHKHHHGNEIHPHGSPNAIPDLCPLNKDNFPKLEWPLWLTEQLVSNTPTSEAF